MPDQLQKYREKDKKNVEGEVQPEDETLNSRYIRDFLRVKMGLETGQPADEESVKRDLDHFDAHFKLNTAIELASKEKDLKHKQTQGEQAIVGVLSKAKEYLDKKGKPDLFDDTNPKSALSNLERLTKENNDYTRRFPELKEAYLTHNMVRTYCRRIFEVERVAIKNRQEQKTEIGGDLKAGFAEKINDIKDHFGNMGSVEKLTMLAVAVIGTGFFMTSDSSRVEDWKEKIFGAIKVGFGFYAANILVKLFTGKTATSTISDWASSTAGNEDFWKKSFHTDAEKAKILQSSMIYLNDHDFVDLTERYQRAKALNTKKIELASVASNDMTPEQIYTALDVFFSQYGGARNPDQNAVNLRKRFRNHQPRAKWLEVVSTMLVEDGRLEFKGNLIERAADEMGAYMTSAWNVAAGTAVGAAVGEVASDVGAGTKQVVGATYGVTKRATKAVWGGGIGATKVVVSGVELIAAPIAWFGDWSTKKTAALLGRPPTKEEVREFQQKKLFNTLVVPHELNRKAKEDALKSKMTEHALSPSEAEIYLTIMRAGRPDQEPNLKYLGRKNAIYMVIDKNMSPKVMELDASSEESVKPIRDSSLQAKEFLKRQYNFSDDEAERSKVDFGIYDVENGIYKLFVRMPKPETVESKKAATKHKQKGERDTLSKEIAEE